MTLILIQTQILNVYNAINIINNRKMFDHLEAMEVSLNKINSRDQLNFENIKENQVNETVFKSYLIKYAFLGVA